MATNSYLEDELAKRGLGTADRPSLSYGGARGSFNQSSTLATFANAKRGDWWIYDGTDGTALGGLTWYNGDTIECTVPVTGTPPNLTSSFIRMGLPTALGSVTIAAKLDTSKIGSANGAAGLDATGKLLTSQIPDAIVAGLKWQSTWDVAANTPSIPAASANNNGWFYRASTAGTANVTGTSVSWAIGDWLISNGTSWQRIVNTLASATPTTQGTIQLAGDFSNTSTASVPKIGFINSVAVPASAPSAARQFIVSTNTSALGYSTLQANDLPSSSSSTLGAIQLTGDLGGTATAPSVAKLNGITVPASAPTKGQIVRASNTSALTYSDVPVDGLIYAANYTTFDSLVTAINASPFANVVVDFTGVSSLVCNTDQTISSSKVVVINGNGATIKSAAATPGLNASDWVQANSYTAGARVRRPDNRIYVANATIPANTAFATGVTGATWKKEAPTITFANTVYIDRLEFNTGEQVFIQGVRSNLRDVMVTTTNLVVQGTDTGLSHCWFNSRIDQAVFGPGIVRTTQTTGEAYVQANAYAVDDVTVYNSKLYRASGPIAANTVFALGSANNQWHPVFYDQTAAYPAGVVVINTTDNTFYESNAAIPANTPFATSNTGSGATWLPIGGPAMLTVDGLGVTVVDTQFAFDNNQNRINAVTITENGNRPSFRKCVFGNLSSTSSIANIIALASYGNLGVGHVIIDDCTLYGAVRNSLIWVVGKAAKWYSHIVNNYYEGYATEAATGPRSKAMVIEGAHGIQISGNRFANIHLHGFFVRYSDDWFMIGNQIPGNGIKGSSSTIYGVFLQKVKGALLQANKFIPFDNAVITGTYHGLYLASCNTVVTSTNQFRGASNITTNYGISNGSDSTNCQHYNNIFFNNTTFTSRFQSGGVGTNVEVGTQALL